MTSYQKIVNYIRASANAANPTGRFINGRLIDFSTAYAGAYPLIVNYPFITREEGDFASASILMAFWLEDRADTTPEEMEAIVSAMAELSDSFIKHLDAVKVISVTGHSGEPQYKTISATLSGFVLRFTLTVPTDC